MKIISLTIILIFSLCVNGCGPSETILFTAAKVSCDANTSLKFEREIQSYITANGRYGKLFDKLYYCSSNKCDFVSLRNSDVFEPNIDDVPGYLDILEPPENIDYFRDDWRDIFNNDRTFNNTLWFVYVSPSEFSYDEYTNIRNCISNNTQEIRKQYSHIKLSNVDDDYEVIPEFSGTVFRKFVGREDYVFQCQDSSLSIELSPRFSIVFIDLSQNNYPDKFSGIGYIEPTPNTLVLSQPEDAVRTQWNTQDLNQWQTIYQNCLDTSGNSLSDYFTISMVERSSVYTDKYYGEE